MFLSADQRQSASAQPSVGHFPLNVTGTEVLSMGTHLTFAELFLFLDALNSQSSRRVETPQILIPEQVQPIPFVLVMHLYHQIFNERLLSDRWWMKAWNLHVICSFILPEQDVGHTTRQL